MQSSLRNESKLGQPVYEYRPQVVRVVEFGMSAAELFSPTTPLPAEGGRLDLHLEGPVTGPHFSGTLVGVDYLRFRADGRADLHIHAQITTTAGDNLALEAGGVATPEAGTSLYQLREHVALMSNHEALLWLNAVEIWATGVVDVSTGSVMVRGYAV
jgi:hypothetical protein